MPEQRLTGQVRTPERSSAADSRIGCHGVSHMIDTGPDAPRQS